MSEETPYLSSPPTTDHCYRCRAQQVKNHLRDSRLIIADAREREYDWAEQVLPDILHLSKGLRYSNTRVVLLEQKIIFTYTVFPEVGMINVRRQMDVSGHGRSLTEMCLPEMILATYLQGGGKVENLRYVSFWQINDRPTRDSIDAVSTHQQRTEPPEPIITPLDSTWEAFMSGNVLVQSSQELAKIISASEEKDVSIRKVQMLESRSGSTYDLGMIAELQHE